VRRYGVEMVKAAAPLLQIDGEMHAETEGPDR
jgi:hypothetical protein